MIQAWIIVEYSSSIGLKSSELLRDSNGRIVFANATVTWQYQASQSEAWIAAQGDMSVDLSC